MHSLYRRGFTLIELLISAAIITIISSIVLVRFNSFDGTVLLKSLAYEVASGIREAQIYSVSVINTVSGAQSGFRYPYGVSFTPGVNGYQFYRYDDTTSYPNNDPTYTSVLKKTILFTSSMEVYDVCVTIGGNDRCHSVDPTITGLDISFRRPEFSAIFYTPGVASGQLSSIQSGKIKLHSTRNPSNVWVVNVTLLGQISVYKE